MSCCKICNKNGSTFKTSCGHIFHQNCLAKSWKEWHLPCPICRTNLAVAQVEKSGSYHVGFETRTHLCICYTVLASTSKIIKHNVIKSNWCRGISGRLFRKPKFLLRECSMCVA